MAKKILIFALVLIISLVAILGVIIFLKTENSGNTQIKDTSVKTDLLTEIVIQVEARKWQFSPQIINVTKGHRVKIIINNIDGPHGIYLPDFNVSDKNSVEFVANKTGEFPFFCSTFCDNCKSMIGKLIITS